MSGPNPSPSLQPSPSTQPGYDSFTGGSGGGTGSGGSTFDDKFRPTTREVASYIKNRTVDDHNNFIGDFTNKTIVTAAEAEDIISLAGPMVLAALQWDPTAAVPTIPDYDIPNVQSLVALFSAILVELTKFSEQISRNVSPYPYLKELFDKMLGEKQGELGISTGETGMSMVDLYMAQSKTAFFDFPTDPMVNWNTAF
jgi:hypothetical protein